VFAGDSGGRVIFIGVDAAWGDASETGVVALEPSGHVREAGWPIGVDEAAAWICDHAEPDTLVFIDAPLIVTNPTGQRLCETHVGQRYWRWSVSANSTNTASRRLGGVALLNALENKGFTYDDGIDGPPRSGQVVSECYPYTTIVGYEPLGYDVRPLYKRKPKAMRLAEFRAVRAAACDVLIERVAALARADPPVHLRTHEVTRKLLEEPSPLDNRAYKHREDLLDAVLCAWTSSLWHRHGFERCQVLGAIPGVVRPAATIIAPARPEQRVA
jgi:predicted RNase H-like nuclease